MKKKTPLVATPFFFGGDATSVALVTSTGLPQPCVADADGAARHLAERRKKGGLPLAKTGVAVDGGV